MYRLMIVEEEQAIAQGIANSLPWEEWGFQISRVCSNGEEALEAIAVECPDSWCFPISACRKWTGLS